MVQLFISCFIIVFWAFIAFSIYFVMVGKEIPGGNVSFVGRVIKWCGHGSILAIVAAAVLGLALTFATMITEYLHISLIG